MTNLKISEVRKDLYRLVDKVSEEHAPIIIAGKRHNAVLMSEEDWNSLQETIYLLSIPGMRESLVKDMKTPASKMVDTLKW